MADRRFWSLLALFLILPPAGLAKAEKVAVFMVGEDDPLKLVDQVKRELSRESKVLARPYVWNAKPINGELLRDVGHRALLTLAGDEHQLRPHDLDTMAEGLAEVSAAVTPEARSVLWNLCLLNVHLRIRAGQGVAPAAEDCRRRFPEQEEFSQVWSASVVDAVRGATTRLERLEVESVPGNCTVLLYGASVGTTPIALNVPAGRQEVAVRCGSKTSKVHEIEVSRPSKLTVRLELDEALVGHHLEYESPQPIERVLDHASSLAHEANADSFILIWPRDAAGTTRLEHLRTADDQPIAQIDLTEDTALAPLTSAASREAWGALLAVPEQQATTPFPAAAPRRRAWQDKALGSSLILAGAALAAFPAWLFASPNGITGPKRDRLFALSAGSISGLLTAGAIVLIHAPFGRPEMQVDVVANGLRLRGTF